MNGFFHELIGNAPAKSRNGSTVTGMTMSSILSSSRNNHLFLITCIVLLIDFKSIRRVAEWLSNQQSSLTHHGGSFIVRSFFKILPWAYESHLNRRRIGIEISADCRKFSKENMVDCSPAEFYTDVMALLRE